MKQGAKYPFSIYISNSWSNKKLPFDDGHHQLAFYPPPLTLCTLAVAHRIRLSSKSFHENFAKAKFTQLSTFFH